MSTSDDDPTSKFEQPPLPLPLPPAPWEEDDNVYVEEWQRSQQQKTDLLPERSLSSEETYATAGTVKRFFLWLLRRR